MTAPHPELLSVGVVSACARYATTSEARLPLSAAGGHRDGLLFRHTFCVARGMRLLFQCGVLGILLSATWVPSALACSAEFCPPPIRLIAPIGSAEVPGNLVYFKVLKDDPGPLSLRVMGGDTIPSSIRMIGKDRVFAPNAPIAPGTVVQLAYALSCPELSGPQSFVFTTTAHAEVSVRDGALEIESLGLAYPNNHSNEAGFVQLRYYDPEDGAAYFLVDRTATIDGMRATIDREGRIKVSSRCSPEFDEYVSDSCGNIYNVPIGEHTVEVRASIVGQASDPPPTRMTVRTECSARCSPSADAGVSSGRAAEEPSPASNDAGSESLIDGGGGSQASAEQAMDQAKSHADLDPANHTPNPAADGCSITSPAQATRPGSLWPLACVLGVWRLGLRVRRRRQTLR